MNHKMTLSTFSLKRALNGAEVVTRNMKRVHTFELHDDLPRDTFIRAKVGDTYYDYDMQGRCLHDEIPHRRFLDLFILESDRAQISAVPMHAPAQVHAPNAPAERDPRSVGERLDEIVTYLAILAVELERDRDDVRAMRNDVREIRDLLRRMDRQPKGGVIRGG